MTTDTNEVPTPRTEDEEQALLRAKWLHIHGAPPDWLIVTAKEMAELKRELIAMTAERDALKEKACVLESQAENAVVNLEQVRMTLRHRAEKAEADAAAMREALNFYSETSKYPAPLTGGMGELWFDCGETARKALSTTAGTELLARLKAAEEDTACMTWLEANAIRAWETGMDWCKRLGVHGSSFRAAVNAARQKDTKP